MKRLHFYLSLTLLFLAISCKKTQVDARNTRTFQSSINDMASSLNTLQQVKFNEALYILKTFAVEGENDVVKLHNLGKLLHGKKIPEIFALADKTAHENSIDWASNGPPSLGNMNIFAHEDPSEHDPNDIKATGLNIVINEIQRDSVLGPKALQIIPRLVDKYGNPIDFSGAGLAVLMDVSNNGVSILSSKNLMLNNNFKGFTLRFSSIPKSKLTSDKIDITITVKTTKKTYKMTKIGVPVNTKALLMPVVNPATTPEDDEITDNMDNSAMDVGDENNTADQDTTTKPTSGNPKTTVLKFLNNLNAQNLKEAYNTSQNPNWGSYESFSNPNSGFGAVKNVNVKSISPEGVNGNTANVNATYDVVDKEGRTTALQVTFGLKNVNGEWKISSYKIK